MIFDPLNNIDGEKKELHILDGKIVSSSEVKKADKIKTIDASNMIIFPGGVDIHAHIAGPKVNVGRLLRPEDHRLSHNPASIIQRAGVGQTVPSTYYTGYAYAKMGYTSVMEPAMPPLKARHTHEELQDIPILDKAAYTLMSGNWFLMERMNELNMKELCAYVSWLLSVTGGYTIKLVNPGGEETWAWGKNVTGLEEKVPYFRTTPKEIITTLSKVNERLNLPHTIHLHTNNLGLPGNFKITKETIDSVKGITPSKKRKRLMHITHLQFSSYGGTSWKNFSSEAKEIAHYVNKNKHITCDVGQVIFGNTTTMTADGAWQWALRCITEHLPWASRSGAKWCNGQIELESSSGVVPYLFRRKNPVNATQWAIGLELLLSINDLSRIAISTDHPNGGPFTFYPIIISWLMSKKAREEMITKSSKAIQETTTLENIEKELSLYEIAQITRASPAKILGFKNKGHLGIGADADIAIYDFPVPLEKLSSEYQIIEKAFSKTAYTIKNGQIVIKNGQIVSSPSGQTYRVEPQIPEDWQIAIQHAIQERFKHYYSVNLRNYAVQKDYLRNSKTLKPSAK
ncbi:MAG: formylmethanofuran dehydrogenase subunit A [Asgard group archaeon]|nr:formylmethanofuran dehydrogenase subunit A [Asgard group archaeon]